MQAFFPDNETIPLPKGHRFPMGKYAALVDRVRALEPEGLRIEAAQAADDATLATVHDLGYVQAVQQGTLPAGAQREIGLPWSPALVQRARRSVGATVAAAQAAMREGLACNLAGGTHHAKAAAGGGFCIFNDVAVAARVDGRFAMRVSPSLVKVGTPLAETRGAYNAVSIVGDAVGRMFVHG
ncbi:MAG: hypothetical protein ACO3T2_08450, partial [Burkholderiaceae bacterium]